MEELVKSFGPPGIPGNILEIKNAANNFKSLCKELIAWEYRLLEITPPDGLKLVKLKLKGCSKVVTDEINRIPNETQGLIEAAKINPGNSNGKGIELKLKFPPEVLEVTEVFKKYVDEYGPFQT